MRTERPRVVCVEHGEGSVITFGYGVKGKLLAIVRWDASERGITGGWYNLADERFKVLNAVVLQRWLEEWFKRRARDKSIGAR